MRVLTVVLPSLLCLGACQDTMAPKPVPAPSMQVVSGDSVRLTYICGNTFRLRNANDAFVEVKWDIFNTADSGRLVLPMRPPGTAFSQVFVTAGQRGTMRVFVDGRLEETKANGNRPVCSTEGQETPWPAVESPAKSWDDSRTVSLAGTIRARRDFLLEFLPEVDPSVRLAALRTVGAVPASRRGPLTYVVRTPDPGADSTTYVALLNRLRALNGVRRVAPVYLTGGTPVIYSRYPSDSASSVGRGRWENGNTAVNHLHLSRVPQSWGCQPADRRVASAPVGVLEWEHSRVLADVAADFVSSTLSSPDTGLVFSDLQRSAWRDHAAHTSGLLAAIGDNGIGTAGNLWSTRIRAMELSTASHRPVPLMEIPARLAAFIESVSVLSLSIEYQLDAIVDSSQRAFYVDDLARIVGEALRRSPNSQVVVAAGNTPWNGTVAGFRQATSDRPWLLLALLQIRQDSTAPAIRDQVVVATGARANGTWASSFQLNNTLGAPHFWNATDIAAQAEDVTALTAASPGAAASGALRDGLFGTSLAAPQVAAVLAAMLKNDPSITPSRRKELLLAGAARMRADAATGIPSLPTPVIPAAGQRAPVLLLNAYEALSALSQSSASMPICGGRVTFDDFLTSVSVPNGPSGPLALPLPAGFVLRAGAASDLHPWNRWAQWGAVAQGGRRISLNVRSVDGTPALVSYDLGPAGWVAGTPTPSPFQRAYLERDTVYWRWYSISQNGGAGLPVGYVRRVTGDSVPFDGIALQRAIPLLTGTTGAFPYRVSFSPDGAFMAVGYSINSSCNLEGGSITGAGIALVALGSGAASDLHRETSGNCANGQPDPWAVDVAWHPSSRSLVRFTQYNAWAVPEQSRYVMRRMRRTEGDAFSAIGSDMASVGQRYAESVRFRGDGAAVTIDEADATAFAQPTPCIERAYPSLATIVTSVAACAAQSTQPLLRSILAQRDAHFPRGHRTVFGPRW